MSDVALAVSATHWAASFVSLRRSGSMPIKEIDESRNSGAS